MLIKHPKDFWAGLMFMGFGLAAIVIGADYPLGSGARMGPGYFPRALGIILIALGAWLALRGFRLQGSPLSFPTFEPFFIILGSVVLFGMTLPTLGLVVATILLIAVSSYASHEYSWRASIISGVVLAAFCVLAFSYGLKLQFQIWPKFLGS